METFELISLELRVSEQIWVKIVFQEISEAAGSRRKKSLYSWLVSGPLPAHVVHVRVMDRGFITVSLPVELCSAHSCTEEC